MHQGFWVYILANKRNGTLYIGCTDNLARRMKEHEAGTASQFTAKYNVKTLIYFEHHQFWETAFKRETQIKSWRREYKLNLIERSNPDWIPLNPNL